MVALTATSGLRRIATPRGPKIEEGTTIGAGRAILAARFWCKAGREDGSGIEEETFDTTFALSPPEETTKGLRSAKGTRAFIPAVSFGGARGGCLAAGAEVMVVQAVLGGRGGGGGNEAARKLGG